MREESEALTALRKALEVPESDEQERPDPRLILSKLIRQGFQIVSSPSQTDVLVHIDTAAAGCPLCAKEHNWHKTDPKTGELIFYPAHNVLPEKLQEFTEAYIPPWAGQDPVIPDVSDSDG